MATEKNIEKAKQLLGEIPADLRPLCEEVMLLVQDSETARILARHRLGQLVDIADDVRRYGVQLVAKLARLFRLNERTLRQAQKIARGWSRNELVAALNEDPMLRLGQVAVLSDVKDRASWLQRIRVHAMSEREIRRAFAGSKRPLPTAGNVRVISPVALANRVLSLATELEEAKIGDAKLSYEQVEQLSQTLVEAALKIAKLERQFVAPRLLKRAG